MTPDQLRKLLSDADVSQSALAVMLDVNRRTVVRWLAGDSPIPAAVAIAIRSLLKAKN